MIDANAEKRRPTSPIANGLQTEAKSDHWKALAYDYLRGAVDGGALPEYTLAEYVAEAEFYATEFEHD